MTIQTTQEPSATALLRLIFGYQVSQAIHVATPLGLADLLADGAREELAALDWSAPADVVPAAAAATGLQRRALPTAAVSSRAASSRRCRLVATPTC